MKNLVKFAAAGASTAATTLAFASSAMAQYYYSDPYADSGFGFIGMLIWCCMILVPTIIWFAVTYWVYTDAQKNNVDSPALWAIITFFTGLIGLILYFVIARSNATTTTTTPVSTPAEGEKK